MMEGTVTRERCACGAEFEFRALPYGNADKAMNEWRDGHAHGCSKMMLQCEGDWRSEHYVSVAETSSKVEG